MEESKHRGTALAMALACVPLGVFLALPPIHQTESYHNFADQRTLLGIPNFWNVTSNIAFVFAAALACRAFRNPHAFKEAWERTAFLILVTGVAFTALGSAYYHLQPNTGTLFWDRLPMTLVFMSILSATIGERISMPAGRWMLAPSLVIGVLSVLYWRLTGDLRWYGMIQFLPIIAIPAILLAFPSRYVGPPGTWGMLAFYILAKFAELFDRQIAKFVSTGGHPWKHILAAVAIVLYAASVQRRQPATESVRESLDL